MAGPRTGNRDYELLDDLFSRSAAYASSDAYRRTLDFLRRFPTEKPFNGFLIFTQNPEASFTLTAHRWDKDYGGRVRRGARPLVVLRPFGPVAFVYDIADVDGANVPPDVMEPFRGTGTVPRGAEDRLAANAATELVAIRSIPQRRSNAGSIGLLESGQYPLATQSPATVGLFDLPDDTPPTWAGYIIEINAALDEASRFMALLHELAHLLLGHVRRAGHHDPAGSEVPTYRDAPEEIVEIEAESVAFLVGSRLGIDGRSAEYLASHHERATTSGSLGAFRFHAVLKVANLLERWCVEHPRRRARTTPL